MNKLKLNRDFTEGPIFTRTLYFVIPIILTGMLQIIYNMADTIIVGRFSGDEFALAAVGSTSTMVGLWTNVTVAISAGAGVLVAQKFGARDDEAVSRSTHTAMAFSLIYAALATAIALIITKPALLLMGTKKEYFDKSVLYMLIICLGIPADSIYNFTSSVLRAVGDSKTSLYALATSGILNVALNLLFVIVFNMSVVGVALATLIAKYISALWVVTVIVKRKGVSYRLSPKRLRLEREPTLKILHEGLPIAFQALLFNFAALIFTVATNTFDISVITARAVSAQFEGILYTAMSAFGIAAMTFIGQNYGAKRATRINKSFLYTLIQVVVISVSLGQLLRLFEVEISGLFMADDVADREAVIEAVRKMNAVMLNYIFTCGILEVLSGALKALGASLLSLIGCVFGIAVRVVWLLVILPIPSFHTIFNLCISYIICWTISIAVLLVFCFYVWKKLGIFKMAREEKAEKL